jgi:hypothetical protein
MGPPVSRFAPVGCFRETPWQCKAFQANNPALDGESGEKKSGPDDFIQPAVCSGSPM